MTSRPHIPLVKLIPPRQWLQSAVVLGLVFTGVSAVRAQNVGSRIVDFIAELEKQGVTVIYSNELLDESMHVQTMPSGEDGIERLQFVIEPFGLRLQPGPRGNWVVVRAEEQPSGNLPADLSANRPVLDFQRPTVENIVVSASRYSIASTAGPSTSVLGHNELIESPSLGEDAIRATHSLPGVSSNGLTARVNVRGGDTDEVRIELDGMPLFDPYHLKDFQGLFSGIDPRIIDTMAVYTSAYPAQFGDRMSGVMEMASVVPEQRRLHEVAVSTLATSLLSSGRFADGKASWLSSARRGNLDLLIDAANSDIGTPQYFDAYTNLRYDLSPDLQVSGGFLILDDKIVLYDSPRTNARAQYRDRYAWVRTRHSLDKLDLDILLSHSGSSNRRDGSIDDAERSTGSLNDNRHFDRSSLDATIGYRPNEDHWLQAGIEFSNLDTLYRFSSRRTDNLVVDLGGLTRTPAEIEESIDINQRQRALFLRYRMHPVDILTTEFGLRWDDQSVPNDRQFSPRFSALFDVSPRTSVRASWGRHFQSQRADELQIGDGVTTLFPAQKSEHAVISLEYTTAGSKMIRFEAYRKEFKDLRPRFENVFARVSLLPELTVDRIELSPTYGEARGYEISLDGEDGAWLWSLSLARSRARDRLAAGRTRRSWEEPWSFKGNARWSGALWTLSAAATWHSGWPSTSLALDDGELVAGRFNAERFAHYASFDIRASRAVRLDRGELEWFFEINNLFNRKNECCLDYEVEFNALNEPTDLDLIRDDWMGVVPVIGFLWRLQSGTQ